MTRKQKQEKRGKRNAKPAFPSLEEILEILLPFLYLSHFLMAEEIHIIFCLTKITADIKYKGKSLS